MSAFKNFTVFIFITTVLINFFKVSSSTFYQTSQCVLVKSKKDATMTKTLKPPLMQTHFCAFVSLSSLSPSTLKYFA